MSKTDRRRRRRRDELEVKLIERVRTDEHVAMP